MRRLNKTFKALSLAASLIFMPPAIAAVITNPESIVDPVIQKLMSAQNIPGVAVALYYNGQEYFYNYGVADENTAQPVNQHTIFEIGSLTKVFTATLLAQQVKAGIMSLNDPVVKYLPSSVSAQNGAINQVTLLQLATHTSSLPDTPPGLMVINRPSYTEADLMDYIAAWQPQYPIGSKYQYSNIGFGLIGYALEGATHEPYQQLLQQNILTPLSMTDTTLNTPADPTRYAQGYNARGLPAIRWPVDAWPAAGALRSTSTDLLAFLEANLDIRTPTASPALLQDMQYAQQSRFTTPLFIQDLGWMRFTKRCTPLVVKFGGTAGFSSLIEMAPAYKIGIIILTNKTATEFVIQRPATRILTELAGC